MGLFDVFTDTIENAIDAGSDLLEGKLPSRRRVAELINDGVSIAAIAAATGASIEAIKRIANSDDD